MDLILSVLEIGKKTASSAISDRRLYIGMTYLHG